MGKLVVTEFVTVDGVFEDPGGSENFEHGGWSFEFNRGDDGDKFKLDETLNSDALLLGRVTYEGFADAWPQRSGDDFSEKFNSMPKHVVSSTLQDPDWNNSTVIDGDLEDEVSKLKEQYEHDVAVHGSGQLARSLLDLGLVDEVRLMVFPVVIGEGKRLFDGIDMHAFELADTMPVGPEGVLVLTYRPKAEVKR